MNMKPALYLARNCKRVYETTIVIIIKTSGYFEIEVGCIRGDSPRKMAWFSLCVKKRGKTLFSLFSLAFSFAKGRKPGRERKEQDTRTLFQRSNLSLFELRQGNKYEVSRTDQSPCRHPPPRIPLSWPPWQQPCRQARRRQQPGQRQPVQQQVPIQHRSQRC